MKLGLSLLDQTVLFFTPTMSLSNSLVAVMGFFNEKMCLCFKKVCKSRCSLSEIKARLSEIQFSLSEIETRLSEISQLSENSFQLSVINSRWSGNKKMQH